MSNANKPNTYADEMTAQKKTFEAMSLMHKTKTKSERENTYFKYVAV